jgi:hypothetical protein
MDRRDPDTTGRRVVLWHNVAYVAVMIAVGGFINGIWFAQIAVIAAQTQPSPRVASDILTFNNNNYRKSGSKRCISFQRGVWRRIIRLPAADFDERQPAFLPPPLSA